MSRCLFHAPGMTQGEHLSTKGTSAEQVPGRDKNISKLVSKCCFAGAAGITCSWRVGSGWAPDWSFKGGRPGLVRMVRPDLLVWPDYDGNGMFKSLGNIRRNPFVGLLFVRMGRGTEASARHRTRGGS